MIDWILIVLESFQTSCDKTFFSAIKFLDMIFSEKRSLKQKISKEELHLYGLTVIFISSKLEDIKPIPLESIEIDAGHSKFTKKQILNAE